MPILDPEVKKPARTTEKGCMTRERIWGGLFVGAQRSSIPLSFLAGDTPQHET